VQRGAGFASLPTLSTPITTRKVPVSPVDFATWCAIFRSSWGLFPSLRLNKWEDGAKMAGNQQFHVWNGTCTHTSSESFVHSNRQWNRQKVLSVPLRIPQPLQLGEGETFEKVFEIAVPANKLAGGVNHFEISSLATPGAERSSFPMTLIAPPRSAKKADGKGARGESGKATEDRGRQGRIIRLTLGQACTRAGWHSGRLALGLICVHFIGILIAVAIISKQSNLLIWQAGQCA
jgi:hypothetical protein